MRIMIADDHKMIREGLRALFNGHPCMDVIAEAVNGKECIQVARETSPEVIIMDVVMPVLNGIEATRHILSVNPKIKIIGLSMYSDRRYIAEMFKAGAWGYLLKDCAFEELVRAIEYVTANQYYLSPSVTGVLIQDYLYKNCEANVFSLLTPREREVLQLIAEGKTTNQIASLLFVSKKTVETHRRQIMKKLNLTSIAELTKYAIREGLTSPEI
ncbi:response regulator [Desulfoscipio gibsoniae]|uniref:Stage 0 sporulation protein A homolog n=1 Tax=Desulfoscipio gibsoniae DSM 7213 TaxID=767817 RepID=R4KDM8_9FIRM|nr:response regulator transcription factor [Desulfoscipio gibsoniae]AGK99791.1 response regulator containing a CheY-like receiver domain and an HTH DNA-binding domain [Desulfoscipio gibsoniae DSM 7213]